jgi:hypothetical protein
MKLACGGTEWFNVELDADNRLVHAKAIAQFLDGEHLTKTRWEIAKPEISDKQLRTFALCSERKTLAWVVKPPTQDPTPAVAGAVLRIPVAVYRQESLKSRTSTGSSRIRENSEAADVAGPHETPPNSHEFSYAAGVYRLEFWDTVRGTVTGTRDIEAAEGFVTCELPELGSDVAIKASGVKQP